MNTVNEYFLNMTDRISFVELKENAELNIKGYTVEKGLPLPIVTNTLVEEIKKGSLGDQLNVSHIVEGMIYILGIDMNFKYNSQYKDILYRFNPKIEDFMLYTGLKLDEEGKHDDSAIVFRALVNINGKNINGLFNYAIQLERIAKKLIESNREEKGNDFLKESTDILESILDLEPKYALAYYKLGYHYKNYGQFLKARLMWEKYLNLDDDKVRLQEIREEISLINDDAEYEEGLNYISRGNYNKALDKLYPLLQRHNDNWNLFYMAGLAYKGTRDYEMAVENFAEAINLGGEHPDLYNELAICLFGIGNINEAIDILSKGIELYKDNYRLVFNRGLIYMQLGLYDIALQDVEKAYNLNPEDMSVRNTYEQLISINR
jgi:tetratricopeptide (TPR) repeat protein